MYITVKNLAAALGKTPRTIQLKIKAGEIRARKIDSKSYEVEIASLPQDWQEKALALSSTVSGVPQSIKTPACPSIGRPLKEKEKKVFAVSQYIKALDYTFSEAEKVNLTATYFGISESTVRRYILKVEKHGVIETGIKTRKVSAWDIAAETFMKAFYLQLMKDRNIQSKISAYNAVCKEAAKRGWKVGSKASAYRILDAIPTLYISYAVGGNRALDNYFYIKRDWTTLKPAQMLVGDQHICDFWVQETVEGKVKYFRPTFYVWEDCATRCIAGLAVDKNYSSQTVLQALYMAICRFGFFDCTYNDNGSSECSSAATQVIDELIALSNGQTQMMDITELYRCKDGSYAVEDEDGNIIDVAKNSDTWRQKRRRIYANVKNAKTKPIERLFSTLEMKMAEAGVPGHVVTLGCPADQEEKESAVLEKQKRNGEILTLSEFVQKFIEEIEHYENTRHSSLGCTPLEALQKHVDAGWKAKLPANMADLDFVFMARKKIKVTKGRVTINLIDFIGEDLATGENGEIQDLGLSLHEGKKIEVRYDPADMKRAYAVLPDTPNPIRALAPVEAIPMLETEEMERMLSWKKHNIKVVREAFKSVAYPESIKLESRVGRQLEESAKLLEGKEITDAEKKKKALIRAALQEDKTRRKKILPFFRNDRERFQWCLDEIIAGEMLSEKDQEFCQRYESGSDYQEEEIYWRNYKRLGGII